jgi:hypothetical protein
MSQWKTQKLDLTTEQYDKLLKAKPLMDYKDGDIKYSIISLKIECIIRVGKEFKQYTIGVGYDSTET